MLHFLPPFLLRMFVPEEEGVGDGGLLRPPSSCVRDALCPVEEEGAGDGG